MGKAAAAMLAGVLMLLALPELPSGGLVVALCAPFVLLLLRQRLRCLLLFPLGFVWCWYVAGDHLSTRLAPEFEGRTLLASGWVHSIPVIRGGLQEFEFAVEELDGRTPAPGLPKLLRFSLDPDVAAVRAGERWRLQLCLRRDATWLWTAH